MRLQLKHLLVATLALVAGCTEAERQEQRDAIRSRLPPGCEIQDVGGYANLDRVLIVTCDGRRSSTVSTTWMSGKVRHYATSVTVEQ